MIWRHKFTVNRTADMALVILSILIIFLRGLAIQCEKINDPTLKPANPFSASIDALLFKKEMQDDLTTNRDKLVELWFHRTFDQRTQIQYYYDNNCCGRDSKPDACPLLWGLQELSTRSMDDLYNDSLLSPENLLGTTIYEVIVGKWKEKGAIEQIVCANDKEMKDRINQFYQAAYQETVETHLGKFKKDDQDYQHVMQQYCWKGLCQDKKIKEEDACKEAQALKAIDPGNDKEGFKKKLNDLLDKNCEPDMKKILEKYRQQQGDIVRAVEKAFEDSDRVERAYNRLVRYIESTCQFYADELHNAVDGCGTDIDKINRIILTRCERDLACILNKYKEIHGETFTNRLKADTTEHRYLESIRYLCGKT